jgi:hypothetical protein
MFGNVTVLPSTILFFCVFFLFSLNLINDFINIIRREREVKKDISQFFRLEG